MFCMSHYFRGGDFDWGFANMAAKQTEKIYNFFKRDFTHHFARISRNLQHQTEKDTSNKLGEQRAHEYFTFNHFYYIFIQKI